MWTEYIAAFLTIETTNRETSNALFIEALEMMFHFRTLTESSINRYRSHADLHLLFQEAFPTFGQLIDRMGRLAGYTHAATFELDELASELPACILDDGFTEMFNEASVALERMRLFYPEWQGPEIYDPLLSIIEWHLFTHGIGFADNEDGVYCAVP